MQIQGGAGASTRSVLYVREDTKRRRQRRRCALSAASLIPFVLAHAPERPKPFIPLTVEFDGVDRADAVLFGQVRKAFSVEPADPAVGADPDQPFGIDLDGMNHVSGEAVLLGIALPGFPIERREAAAEGPDPEPVLRIDARRDDIVGVVL